MKKNIIRMFIILLFCTFITSLLNFSYAAKEPIGLNNSTVWHKMKITDSDKVEKVKIYNFNSTYPYSDSLYGAQLQFFDFINNGNEKTLFTSNLKQDGKNIIINKLINGNHQSMTVKNFGHGQGFAVDKYENIYIGSLQHTFLNKYGEERTTSLGFSKFSFKNGATEKYHSGTTYIFSKKEVNDYSKLKVSDLKLGLRPALDEEHGQIGFRTTNTGNAFYVYDIADLSKLQTYTATITDFKTDEQEGITLNVSNFHDIAPKAKISIKKYSARTSNTRNCTLWRTFIYFKRCILLPSKKSGYGI